MNASDARGLVHALGADDRAAVAVADAPEPSRSRLGALRGILNPNDDDGAPTDQGAVVHDHRSRHSHVDRA